MLQNKKKKVFITKVKPGTMFKTNGPIAIEIKAINSFGQVEICFVMDKETFIEKNPQVVE